MLFLLKLPYIARSERTTKSKSRSNLFYSPLFLTKKQCDHENHTHIQRSTYEGHQYIYWLKSSSFETQVARNSIYILFSESGEDQIGIYDLTGKKKRIIDQFNGKDGKVLNKSLYYIAVSNDEKIFVSGWDIQSFTAAVYCLESSGNVLYTVSNPLFKYCGGIRVDENENVLVCDCRSNKVFLITKDGKEVREFLTEKDGLYQPCTISFRSSDGTLVVGGEHKKLLVFTLK